MVAPRVPRRYWDSYCFIALMDENDPLSEVCQTIMSEASDGNIEIVVSPLTLVEVVRPKGTEHPISRDQEQKIRDFFENDYIIMRNLDRELSEQARNLCWEHGVHPRDAIHLATALDAQCEFLETNDTRLLRLNGQIVNSPIVIRQPTWTGQPPLPGIKDTPA